MRRKHRRLRKNEIKKQRRIIALSLIGITFLFASGYAAFSTSLNINAKGNLKEKPFFINSLKNKVIISGDGLYKDSYEENRYIYRGSNPNNYIKFDNEIWRIIAIESDGTLKIIKNDRLELSLAFDKTTPSRYDINGYCSDLHNNSYVGCNAWNAVDGTFTNGTKQGTVTTNSSLNDYLNNNYYNGLLPDYKNTIQQHIFYKGSVGWGETYKQMIENEKNDSWTGYIAILSISDFYKGSNSTNCNENVNDWGTSNSHFCFEQNYLASSTQWTLNTYKPTSCYQFNLQVSGENKYLNAASASNTGYVKPVLHLKSTITLTGKGTEQNPYTIN